MNKNEWEERFDKEFYEGERNATCCKKHKAYATPFEVKRFISKELSQARKQEQSKYKSKADAFRRGYQKANDRAVRIVEEYPLRNNMKETIITTMTAVGEPIVFTALAMTGGLIVWVFSPLMFQATMGFFLATILLLNMLGGLFLVPSFVAVLKPKFVVGKK